MIIWYLYNYFWRRGDGDGDDSPQDWDDGTGDLIFNTCGRDAKKRCVDDRAIRTFKESAKLLAARKRWLDEMNLGTEAPNRWVWYPYKTWKEFLKWLGFKVTYKWSRPQNDMTRDPYKAFGAQYANLIRYADKLCWPEIIETFLSVTPPWYTYIFNPSFIIWWNKLKRDDRKHFVKRLGFFERQASNDIYLRLYEDDFFDDRPYEAN